MTETRTFNDKKHANNWYNYMNRQYKHKFSALSVWYSLDEKAWKGAIVWKV